MSFFVVAAPGRSIQIMKITYNYQNVHVKIARFFGGKQLFYSSNRACYFSKFKLRVFKHNIAKTIFSGYVGTVFEKKNNNIRCLKVFGMNLVSSLVCIEVSFNLNFI